MEVLFSVCEMISITWAEQRHVLLGYVNTLDILMYKQESRHASAFSPLCYFFSLKNKVYSNILTFIFKHVGQHTVRFFINQSAPRKQGSAILFSHGVFSSRANLLVGVFSALGVRYVFQWLQHWTDFISYSVITKYISDPRYHKGNLNTKHSINWDIPMINPGLFRLFELYFMCKLFKNESVAKLW